MAQLKTINLSKDVKVFRPKASQRRLGIIFFLLLGLIWPGLYFFGALFGSVRTEVFYNGGNGQATQLFLLFAVGTVLFGGLGFWVYRSLAGQRLAINRGGITYKSNGGHSIRAAWNDITGYGTLKKGITEVEGFFVNKDAVNVNNGLKAIVFLKPFILVVGILTGRVVGVGIPSSLDYTRQIPLSLFSDYWLEDEIGELIKQYCPGLFVPAGHLNSGDVIRGDIAAPIAPQLSELQPPTGQDLKGAKDNVIGPLTCGLLLTSLLIVILSFVVNTNKEAVVRAQVTQAAQTVASENSQKTAISQATATTATQIDANIKNFAQNLPPVLDPTTGYLSFTNRQQTLSSIPNAKFNTFFATAYFYNPFSNVNGSWSYGFVVTSSAGLRYRLYINDQGVYSIYEIQGSGFNAKETRLDSGKNSRIDTTNNGSNVVTIEKTEDELYFLINNHFVSAVKLGVDKSTYELKLAYEPNFTAKAPSDKPLHFKEFSVRGSYT